MTEEKTTLGYKPNKQEQERINDIYSEFDDDWELHQRGFKYFDDATINDYINDSVKRWNGYIPPRQTDDWQAHTFVQETRNKVIAIASFIASQRMRAEFSARSKTKFADKQMSSVLASLYNYSMDAEQGDQKFLLTSMEALIKGTVIVFEGYEYSVREVNNVTKYNWDTGEFDSKKEERIDADNCYQKIIPLEDVFIPNFYEPDIQKQAHVIIREHVDYSVFKTRYRKYKNLKFVQLKSKSDEKQGTLEFWENWQERVEDTTVEVLHYYNKWEDRYDVLANGVLLTPLDNPIIFDHKDYPFSKTVFEPMAVDFFYGKSLPQKLMSDQDALNTLQNMFLDRTHLSIIPAFLTSITDEIEEDNIGPGQRVQVSDPSKVRELNVNPIQQGDIQMAEMVRDNMNKSSVDPAQQGQVSGDTATAVLQARESSIQIMGLFINFLGWLVYQQAKQRIANILQFYPQPNTLKDSEGKFAMKETVMEEQTLSDGDIGLRIIRLVGDRKQVPEKEESQEEAAKIQEETGQEVEIHYITPNILKNIDFQVKIVPTSSIPETRSLRRAMTLEYANTAFQFFGDMINREKVLEKINEVFDYNHEQMMKPEEQVQQEQEAMQEQQMLEQGGEAPQGQGPQPQEQGQNSELVQQLAGTKKPSSRELLELPK